MTNEYWRCGECGRVEADSIQVARIPLRLFQIWRFGKLLSLPLPDLEDLYKDEHQGQQVLVEVRAMCHHCGKPLCQKHRVLIVDDVFGVDRDVARTLLPAWWPQGTEFKASKRFRTIENQVLSLLVKYHPQARELKQKAYHCQDCWQNHHPLTAPEFEKV
jgi:hypothetical protein